MPIVSLQTGTIIAETSEMIIDPRQLKVVAFYCEGPGLDVRPAILNISDIREIGSLGIIVDSTDVFMPPEDLVRLKEVLDYKFNLLDKKVVDTAGNKLGTVVNFALDSTTLYIVKLHVRPKFFAAFNVAENLIDRSQIEQVTDSEVIVQSGRVKDREKSKAKRKARTALNPLKSAPVESAAKAQVPQK